MWSICLSIPPTTPPHVLPGFHSVFCLCHLCFSAASCQESSLCQTKKKLFCSPFLPADLSFSILCLSFCFVWLCGDTTNLLVPGPLEVLIGSPVAYLEMGATPICSVWVCKFLCLCVSSHMLCCVYVEAHVPVLYMKTC